MGLGARSLFPAFDYQTPPGSPSAQGGMDTFSPPVSSAMPAAGPSISVITPYANPDEAIAMCLDGGATSFYPLFYGQSNANDGWRLADRVQARRISAVDFTQNVAAWAIPANLPQSAYAVVPITAAGAGKPILMNVANPWWLNGSTTGYQTCVVGDTISVFGTGMCKAIRSTSLISFDGSTTTLEFVVPAGLTIPSTQTAYIVPDQKGVKCGGNSIRGTVTYSGTTLTLTVDTSKTRGSGTWSAWNIYVTTYAFVWLDVAGQRAYATLTSANPFRLQFTLPATVGSHTLVAGNVISVWVNGGNAGNTYGWALCPQQITVGTLTSIGINYTANTDTYTGSGGDDLAALQAKVNALNATGGEITLTGTIRLSNTLTIGGNVSLKGNGVGSTIIMPASFSAGNTLIDGSAASFAQLKELTVQNNGVSFFFVNFMVNVTRVINCEISTTSGRPLKTGVTDSHGYVTGSDIYGWGVAGGGNSSFYWKGSRHFQRGTTDTEAALLLSSSFNIYVEDSTFEDWTALGQNGRGRIADLSGDEFNIYMDGMTSSLTPIASNNGGEQLILHLTLEDLTTTVTGYDDSTGVSKVTVAENCPWGGTGANHSHCFFRNGKGAGQCGRIVSATGSGPTTFTLDVKFRVAPAIGSTTVTFQRGVSRMVAHNSNIATTGSPGGIFGSASCIATVYILCSELIFDNISGENLNFGFDGQTFVGWRIPHSNLVFNNISLTGCGYAIRTLGAADASPLMFGQVFRNVVATDTTEADMYVGHSFYDMIVLDHCILQDADIGVDSGLAVNGHGIESLWNTIIDTPTTYSGSFGLSTQSQASPPVIMSNYGTSRIGYPGGVQANGGFQSNNQPV